MQQDDKEMEGDGIGDHTAKEKGPHRSEDWSIIIPQPGESLGHPSVRGTIIVHMPSS